VQNRLPENSRAIAEAAKKGDLRENADYSAAREERQRLTEAATRIEAELLKAKVITRDLADAQRVTVGSTVRAVEEASGREEVFTFLGPWDAAPEKRVFSYRSPLGLAFMGKRVGETATLSSGGETRRWRIAGLRWEAG
jgi:Transcription elongation factor